MKNLGLCLAIFLSVGLMFWQFKSKNDTHNIPAQTQHLEWFGKNVTMVEMDTQGHVKQKITAQQLQHYMPDNMTDLSDVRVDFFSQDQDIWELQSDKGRLFHGEDKKNITRIDLWHNVALSRPRSDTQSAVTIQTSTLAISPEKEYAHTDQYTIVKQEGHQMSGVGMEIFFPEQKFYLLNNVSSIHEDAS